MSKEDYSELEAAHDEAVKEEVVEETSVDEETPAEETPAEEETPIEEKVPDETEVEETPEEVVEEIPKEPTDQAERSKFGRKLKVMEDKFDLLLNKLNTMGSGADTPAEEDEIDEDGYVKVKDIDKIIERRDQAKTTARQEYDLEYSSTILSIGDADNTPPAEQDIIMERMDKDFNKIHTGDPSMDARINYRDAERQILLEKASTPKSPLKGGAPEQPLGVGGGQSNSVKTPVTEVKLDPHAAEFAARYGYSAEKIKEVIDKPTKNHLANRG